MQFNRVNNKERKFSSVTSSVSLSAFARIPCAHRTCRSRCVGKAKRLHGGFWRQEASVFPPPFLPLSLQACFTAKFALRVAKLIERAHFENII